jgi:dCMP deaminase
MNKVYISGALTGIEKPAEVKTFYEAIGLLCQKIGFQAYVPHLYTDPINNPDISPSQVFERDKHQVSTSDLVIAYLGSFSFGVGMELAYAEMNNIPIVIIYEKDKVISRFPLGIPTLIAEVQFQTYEDALNQLKNVLEQKKIQQLMNKTYQRPSWDEYFLMLAKLAATRSTCLAFPVGAVIAKNRQVLATGYNGSPSGSVHCTAQGFCYPGLSSCDASKTLPSRAVHAEANAIATAAKHGISTAGASIYVTLEPCIYCLKLIISAGIREVFYETVFNSGEKAELRDSFIADGIVEFKQIKLSESTAKRSASFLLNPTSVPKDDRPFGS